MEHLYHLNDGILVQVPLYADVEDLCGRNDAMAWDKRRLKSYGDFQGHSQDEIARFFQSWLYFDFLQNFFDGFSRFCLSDFVAKDSSGNHVVTTVRLAHWLVEWFVWVTENHTIQQVQKILYEALDRLFADVHEAIAVFCSIGRSAPYHGPIYPGVPEELSLSILVLFSTLEKAATQVTARRFHYDVGNSKFLIRLLHQRGWCPTDAEWLSLRNIDTLYSAATGNRPDLQVQHDRCQPWQCVAFQVEDESEYEQAHTDGCQGCTSKKVPIADLCALVENNRIPLVSLDDSEDRLTLTSVSRESVDDEGRQMPFVALSHVWSDGLGNPTANALPLCQLQRLQRLVENATGLPASKTRTWWWCDTLCVPARGLADESRKLAIQTMRDVYQGASQVLVLDQLLTSQLRDVLPIQAYLCIISSRWMRRIWTFHEAVLAKDLIVQFHDGPARLADLYYAMLNSKSPAIMHSWYDNDCIEALKPFIEGQDMEQSFDVAIYRSVAVRSTSRRADETICLGNVQGINIKTILDIAEDDYEGRMTEYFRLVRKLPIVLLFQRQPRLSAVGFRWAPTSLLTQFRQSPTSLVYTDHEEMVVSEDGSGVSVRLPGALMRSSQNGYVTGHHFGLTITHAPENVSHFIVYYGPGEAYGEKEYPDQMQTLDTPGLVLCYPLESPEFESFARAVLVNIIDAPGDSSYTADYIALVGMQPVPATVFDAQFQKSRSFTVWQGVILADTTSWLLR